MTTEARPMASVEGDRGPAVIAVAVVGVAVPTIAVALRFISRARAPGEFWWDDWAVLGTVIFSHGFLALIIAWTNAGLGKHFLAVPVSDAKPSNNMSHAAIELYAVCIWMVKISTLLLYARLFKIHRSLAWTLWGVGAFVTAWFLCTALVPWFNCTPVRKTIELFAPGVCYNRMSWYYSSAFINAFIDLFILLLPVPTILRLHMALRRKVSVVFVFLLGYCSAFLSFARFIIIVRDPTVMSVTAAADPTWRLVPLLILSMLEAPFAIVALYAPSIHQLATRTLGPRTLSSRFRSIFSTSGSAGSGNSRSSHSRSSHSDIDRSKSGCTTVELKLQNSPSYGSMTAFANRRGSDEDSQGQPTALPVPLDAIGGSRIVEVTRDLESGMGLKS